MMHDALDTLRNCCLVPKSWIARTRKHLFANIRFHLERDLLSWKKTFPDLSTSPACYTKTLFVGCSHAITTTDAEPGGWITGFSRVVHLKLVNRVAVSYSADDFTPFNFRGFSPTIKSLHIHFIVLSISETFDLVLSFLLLENLTVTAHTERVADEDDGSDGLSTDFQPSSSPMFTGSLELSLGGGNARQAIGETVRGQWSGLDRFLVQFRE